MSADAADVASLGRSVDRLRRFLTVAGARGRLTADSTSPSFDVAPPATEEDLRAVEAETGRPIPPGLRRLFGTAASIDVEWRFDEKDVAPPPLRQVFTGRCHWDLADVPRLLSSQRAWIDIVFPDPADPYDAVWHDAYPFLEALNGDFIAVDGAGRVVYLSHEDDLGHGYAMGPGIFELLETWSVLGCPGPEDWQWLPFAAASGAGLDTTGAASAAWLAWVGLPPAA